MASENQLGLVHTHLHSKQLVGQAVRGMEKVSDEQDQA
jgi:hypothetical protein